MWCLKIGAWYPALVLEDWVGRNRIYPFFPGEQLGIEEVGETIVLKPLRGDLIIMKRRPERIVQIWVVLVLGGHSDFICSMRT